MAALISSSRLLSPRLQKEDGEGREGYYQVLSIVVISGAVLTLARNLIFKRKTPFHAKLVLSSKTSANRMLCHHPGRAC